VGSKKNPIWRVVVADQRSPRDGRFIETIGRYNPQTNPSTIAIDEERLEHWLARGAQPTGAVKQLLKAQAKGGGPAPEGGVAVGAPDAPAAAGPGAGAAAPGSPDAGAAGAESAALQEPDAPAPEAPSTPVEAGSAEPEPAAPVEPTEAEPEAPASDS
jgi:small subunit ribosomal protein S16